MTDVEKFRALMEEFGLVLSETEVGNGHTMLSLKANAGPKQDGYMCHRCSTPGFFTEFEFAEDGSFIDMGVWE